MSSAHSGGAGLQPGPHVRRAAGGVGAAVGVHGDVRAAGASVQPAVPAARRVAVGPRAAAPAPAARAVSTADVQPAVRDAASVLELITCKLGKTCLQLIYFFWL